MGKHAHMIARPALTDHTICQRIADLLAYNVGIVPGPRGRDVLGIVIEPQEVTLRLTAEDADLAMVECRSRRLRLRSGDLESHVLAKLVDAKCRGGMVLVTWSVEEE